MLTSDKFTYANGAIIVLTKSPELGQVKTRMQPLLSQQASVKIHCALAQYSVEQWQQSQLCPLYYFVKGDKTLLQQAIPAYKDQQLLSQADGDLGDKMLSSANIIASKYQPQFIILLGTDCPFITKDYLQQAIGALSNHDVVIGPAHDGGYVLLGFKTVHAELFRNIAWSSERVLSDTQDILKKNNISAKLLEYLSDIDHPRDLSILKPIQSLAWLADLLPSKTD